MLCSARAIGHDDRRQRRTAHRHGVVKRRDVTADGRAREGLCHTFRRETPFVAVALEHVLPRGRCLRMHAGKLVCPFCRNIQHLICKERSKNYINIR